MHVDLRSPLLHSHCFRIYYIFIFVFNTKNSCNVSGVVGGDFLDNDPGSLSGTTGVAIGVSSVVNGAGVGGRGITGPKCRMNSY